MSAVLLAELKRRRVFRALVAYAIVVFAILQVVEPIMHGLALPDWTLSFVIIALGLGFPVVLVLAWIFDVSAAGVERTAPLQPEGTARFSRARIALLVPAMALLAAAPAAVWYLVSRTGTMRARPSVTASVAVLPFVNLSRDKEDEYFSDGFTEEIINALANVKGVRVVSRTSAFAFKGKNLSIRKIAEELAVASVLEGSVRREGSQLRIVAQLINAADGYHLWSKTYDRELHNVFAVEDELARSIAVALRPQLLKGASPLVQQPTSSMDAHDLYLKGRHHWNKRTGEDLRKAIALFQQALELDPAYALAHAGLADSYLLLSEYSEAPPPEVIPKAKAHAYKAMELDGTLAEPHATLGLISANDYEWRTAEREYKRAIELRSGYATAHHWYALLLGSQARFAEARAQAEQALQLDPASRVVNNMLGVVLLQSRDYQGAIDAFQKTLDLDGGFASAHELLACAYLGAGRRAEALAELGRATESGVKHAALRAWVLAEMGDLTAATRLLRDLEGRSHREYVDLGMLAALHAQTGDKDRAFALLDKAYAERDWSLRDLKVSPVWDPLRSDPRFSRLLKRVNLD